MINKQKQKKLASEDLEHHAEREEHHAHIDSDRAAKSRKVKIIALSIVVGLFLIIGIPLAIHAMTPGKWDDFARCLTEHGAVMQGEEWCQFTNAQKGMFGKSFKYINYEIKEDLRYRPTWVIDGEQYEKVQSFERLSALTGCSLQK